MSPGRPRSPAKVRGARATADVPGSGRKCSSAALSLSAPPARAPCSVLPGTGTGHLRTRRPPRSSCEEGWERRDSSLARVSKLEDSPTTERGFQRAQENKTDTAPGEQKGRSNATDVLKRRGNASASPNPRGMDRSGDSLGPELLAHSGHCCAGDGLSRPCLPLIFGVLALFLVRV